MEMLNKSDNVHLIEETRSTNYLSPQMFYGPFLEHLVLLDEFHSETRPSAMDANHFYWAARIQYGSGLRISEVLNLEKRDFDLNHRILTLRDTKTGKGKIQKTTILPYDAAKLDKFLDTYSDSERPFQTTRSTMWRYYKNASILGNLNIFNAKEIVNIEGAYTHLMRESCSKMYESAGARFGIVARKLRHKPGRNVTLRYTIADLNEVLDFDWDHFKELP